MTHADHDRAVEIPLKVCVGLGLLAVLLRTFSLGTFSLWLDEVFTMLWSKGSLAETWASSHFDFYHPPLSNLIAWSLRQLGLTETAMRLVPVACGVATVLLLMHWVARHFGRRAGTIAGLIAALSPVHIRYSQELRPYPYLLFFVALALVAFDLLIERQSAQACGLLFIALCGGLYSHYLFSLILIPLAVLALELGMSKRADGGTQNLRAVTALLGVSLVAGVAFLPWLKTVQALLHSAPAAGPTQWGVSTAASVWELLSVSAFEARKLSAGGVIALGLLALGVATTLGDKHGRFVFAGALMGTLGPVLLLQQHSHYWSGRYHLVAWVFTVTLVAVGIDYLWSLARWRWVGLAALATLCVVLLRGVKAYDRGGRPHWDRVAAAVRHLHNPGERIFVENDWTRICLAYYLFGKDFDRVPAEEGGPISVSGDEAAVLRQWPGGTTAVMVTSGFPKSEKLRRDLERFPIMARFPLSDDARVYLLTPEVLATFSAPSGAGPATRTVGCSDGFRLLPAVLRRPDEGRLDELRGRLRGRPGPHAIAGGGLRFDFDPITTSDALVSGWSWFERVPSGGTFVWVEGRKAVLAPDQPPTTPQRLVFRAWPASVAGRVQSVDVCLSGSMLGSAVLRGGPQEIFFEIPSGAWRTGENWIEFNFAYDVAPSDVIRGSGDHRRLAAAFDWLELRAASPGDGSS